MKRGPALSYLWIVFCPLGFAHAHSSGHGPEIQGRGPHGGKLTAIVSAKEAELGAKAAGSDITHRKSVRCD